MPPLLLNWHIWKQRGLLYVYTLPKSLQKDMKDILQIFREVQKAYPLYIQIHFIDC